jgi:hypothetical protein
MPSRAPFVAVLALATTAAAQGIVSPHPAFATQEGDLSTPYLFTRPSRVQQIHEDLGGVSRLIQAISFRRDGILDGDPHPAVAPKVATLTLRIARAVPCARASATFAANEVTQPSVVFQGNVSTPAAWQIPAREAPAPFDLRLPIAAWAWDGQGAFLWDAESTATLNTDRVGLDAAQPAFQLFAWCSYRMVGSGCTTPNGEFALRGSGQTLGAPIQQFTVRVSGRGGPAGAPSAWLVGFAPAAATVAGLCGPVWPAVVASQSGTTDAVGAWDPLLQLPNNQAFVGLPVHMQAAAIDASQPGLPVAVSNGLEYRIEPLGPAFRVCLVQSATQGAPSGTLLQRALVVRFD